MKKKIFVFTSVHNWNDTRIFHKECKSLAKRYIVEFHAPYAEEETIIDGINIVGLPKWRSKKDRIKINLILLKRILKSDADVFHFHDPELIFTAILIKLKGKKVIYDVHENIREQIKSKENLNVVKRAVYSIGYQIIEKLLSLFIDCFVLAENSYSSLYDSNKSVIVLNYPKYIEIIKKPLQIGKVVYVGNWIQAERGAMELIEAAYILKQKQIKFEIFWLGLFETGSSLKGEVMAKIKQYELQDNIVFLNRIDYSKLFEVIGDANIGFSCLHPVRNFLKSYPTKMFEYMMAGVPVVASDFPLWREVIDKYDCGYCVDPLNYSDIAAAIENAINNPEKAELMGKNGEKAIKTEYNWKTQEIKLLKYYENLLKEI